MLFWWQSGFINSYETSLYPYSIFTTFLWVATRHFVIMRSLYSKDTRVTKYQVVIHTSLQENNNSLPIVGDRYSSTRTRNTFASLNMSIQAFDIPSYWYNLSINNDGSLCKLLLLEEWIFLSILLTCGLIHQKVVIGAMTTIIVYDKWKLLITEYKLVNVKINKWKVDVLVRNKLVRRDEYFIRIGNKHYHSYLKASKQYSIGHLPPVINTCHTSRIFLKSITIDISDSISWSEGINNNSLKRNEVQTSNVKIIHISKTIIIDNSPVLWSKYPLLESLAMKTSDLKNKKIKFQGCYERIHLCFRR